MLHGLLKGRKGLILGVANAHSIAWAVARNCAVAGADLAITYQGERFASKVEKLVEGEGIQATLYPCDATEQDSVRQMFQGVERDLGRLDFVLHAWAFAPRTALKADYLDTSWDDYALAQRVSAHSLVHIAREAKPMMAGGGSIVALSYLGSERVVPGYNVMGVAKASLEASVRYLAHDLGRENIRVNAVSPGPISTLSARGVSGFTEMLEQHRSVAPLGRNVEADEVGGAAVFLFSDLSSGITGEVLYVDAGYHMMGV